MPHRLLTVPGGKYGNLTGDEYVKVYSGVREFLSRFDLVPR